MTKRSGFVVSSLLAAGLIFSAGAVFAYPVVGEEHVSGTVTSVYRDGYQQNGTGVVYTYYFEKLPDNTWSARKELRDLATVQARIATGEVQLQGYNWSTNAWDVYPGTGNDLQPHMTNYGWNYGYLIGFDGDAVTVDVQMAIDFDESLNLSEEQQNALRSTYETNIEGWWNNRYWIVKDGEIIFDLVFDVTLEGYPGDPRWDQIVEVHPDPGRATINDWYLSDGAQTNAHEFGHMLGLYDEYWEGAINPVSLYTSDDYLMGAPIGSLSFGSGLKPEYFSAFVTWLDDRDPDPEQWYMIMRVTAPASVWIIIMGLCFILFYRWRGVSMISPHASYSYRQA